MNTLVTGAAGFIGYHLCERLLARGDRVLGVDNFSNYYDPALKRDRVARLAGHDAFDFRAAELADRAAVGELFDAGDFDVVYHLAAQAGVRYSLKNPHAYVESNLVGFVNVLEGCRGHGAPHLVYASSSSVYGANEKVPFSVEDPVEQPVSLYAATKRSNELIAFSYAQMYEMPITGLRLFTVYGPWGRPDMALYRFTNAMTRGEPIDVYNFGRMRRDFTYVDDIVSGVVLAGDASRGREPSDAAGHRLYNLGNNQPVELGRLIELIEAALGVTAQKRMLPMQTGDVVETYADIDLSTEQLGYRPTTSIETGVERFVEWYRSYYADRPHKALA
ncbi:UDP-glucose 4-epimerase [Pseudobythopirellula maris]|uniref:UDP-glucose 4-epimerase n=1 Tax=Pseudobythopirellula maris TaxID=2527991 RepID=A0A5C5ZR24_9BACT|nr:NAD-dependent epimerase/dehydratase family protein [Pseudobythopirellula maris]TWT89730.1 UDP-glucose 4-epimerase [Pseudobythopirellula maris]